VPRVIVKICGLSTAPTLEAAIGAGADMAGFVFHEKSPRHIDLDAARSLGALASGRIKKVALTVDADDDALDAVVEALSPDYLQLHGSESPARVEAVKARFGLPAIKAIGVATENDVRKAKEFAAADIILFDAKPAPGAGLPGGAGVVFDWRLLRNISAISWMLSGGLSAENLAEALKATGAPGVDVSSGVESARGIKDISRIKAFVGAARALSSPTAKV
jgi:phosphoribosylanthranilate isomerase